VGFNGGGRDGQSCGNLIIGQTLDQQDQHLTLEDDQVEAGLGGLREARGRWVEPTYCLRFCSMKAYQP
jgi:hypothetical protein